MDDYSFDPSRTSFGDNSHMNSNNNSRLHEPFLSTPSGVGTNNMPNIAGAAQNQQWIPQAMMMFNQNAILAPNLSQDPWNMNAVQAIPMQLTRPSSIPPNTPHNMQRQQQQQMSNMQLSQPMRSYEHPQLSQSQLQNMGSSFIPQFPQQNIQYPSMQRLPSSFLPTHVSSNNTQAATPIQPMLQFNSQAANNMSSAPQMFQQPQFLPPTPTKPSPPVGGRAGDDNVIQKALLKSLPAGKTLRQTLESLDGINGYSSLQWKDYYLDNKERFDKLFVKQEELTAERNTESPMVEFSAESSSKRPSADSPKSPKKRQEPRSHSSTPLNMAPSARSSSAPKSSKADTIPKNEPRRRQTINSILVSTMPGTLPPGLQLPHADIQVPEPPSRSPTPPDDVEPLPSRKGNKYTVQDKEYFVKFITWRLENDPSLTKQELCTALSQKASHHSASSWAAHWHSRHDLADKILFSYNQKVLESASNEKGSPDPEESSDPNSSSDESSQEEVRFPNEKDKKSLGGKGDPYTAAELRIFAFEIARSRDWNNDRTAFWSNFLDKYPQRSISSWREYYRRHENEVDDMINKYKRQLRKQEKETPQIDQHSMPPRLSKRKASISNQDFKRRTLKQAKIANADEDEVSSATDSEIDADYEEE